MQGSLFLLPHPPLACDYLSKHMLHSYFHAHHSTWVDNYRPHTKRHLPHTQLCCFAYHSFHSHSVHATCKLACFYHHTHYCLAIAFQTMCYMLIFTLTTARGWTTTDHTQSDTCFTLNLMLWVPLSSPSQCSYHMQAMPFLLPHPLLSCNCLSKHMLQAYLVCSLVLFITICCTSIFMSFAPVHDLCDS